MQPTAINAWGGEVRAGSNGGFQLNLWIPDPPPMRDADAEDAGARLPGGWGPEVAREAGDVTPPDFAAQCEAMLEAGPAVVSSIMGLFPPEFVERMKAKGIAWFANATTVAEASAAEAAGADVIVAQGMEAGGHRGAFDRPRRRPSWSASSRSCRRSSTRCGCRSSPPAASPMRAASPRR